ncbi:hypothetical protein NQ317_006020 [Molorchus minor]|uniref:Uncharacterized protein n=1 Tax=Molorchus minor TaxID=1323400 RepID=A0ABQ9IVQ6_9CUCU|nr:hypothetical protein NQ317_006020 [Molorchus minor]
MFVFGFKQRVWCLSIYFRVQGIDFEYSRTDPSPPDLAPTLPKARTIVFGVFPYIFRFNESIATIPEMFRALPTFPELSLFFPKPKNTVFGVFVYIFKSKESIATIPETIRALPTFPELSLFFPKPKNTVRGIDWDYSRNDPSPPDFSRTLPKPKTTVFGVFIYIFKSKELIETIPEMIRALPTFPELSRFCPNTPEGYKHRVWYLSLYFRVQGTDFDHSRNDPSTPELAQTLSKPKIIVFGAFAHIFKSKESIATIPEMCEESITIIPDTIRALPIFSELSRSLKPPCLVQGIVCDYSRNDPSPPDFSRTLPKPKTTVFGVFAHIFRSKESIATIPEMIRALPTLPEFSRFFPNSPEG